MVSLSLLTLLASYRRGKQFALRDSLQESDAIVVLAGTRGKIEFLDGKIRTAANLYKEGWAPKLICSGRFSAMVPSHTAEFFTPQELEQAVAAGRIEPSTGATALKSWDKALGAQYMCERAIAMGIPADRIIVENQSLHTRENAEYVCRILKEQGMRRIILVTSPFHQLRTFLTFAKVVQECEAGIEILNHYATTGEWHPWFWFLSKTCRDLVRGEQKRIMAYRAKGDLL